MCLVYRCNEIFWFSDKLNNSLDGNISERVVFKTINIYVNEIRLSSPANLPFLMYHIKEIAALKRVLIRTE